MYTSMNGFCVKKPRSLVNTYAIRLGRFCYLQHFCGDQHPVFLIETNLLQMAESKLREQLYVTYGVSRLDQTRVELEKNIRSMAKHNISEQIEDDRDRSVIFSIIDDMDLNSIFVTH